jgi:hypothetical protein
MNRKNESGFLMNRETEPGFLMNIENEPGFLMNQKNELGFLLNICRCAPADQCILDCAPAKPHHAPANQIGVRCLNNRNSTRVDMICMFVCKFMKFFVKYVCSIFFQKVAFFRALFEFILFLLLKYPSHPAKTRFSGCRWYYYRYSSIW